ncbi:Ig-like domain-containing protein, partial [Nanoarchaeota archaeon]
MLLTVSSAFAAFTVTLIDPADSEVITTDSYTVNVTIDNAANITLVNVSINGEVICSNDTVDLTEYLCVWDTTSTGDGVYTIYANATNSTGYSAIDNSTNVIVDLEGPVVTINDPENDTDISDTTPDITFNFTDAVS